MEQSQPTSGILDLMIQPAFTVKNGVIDVVNQAAGQYRLEPGTHISDILVTGKDEYAALAEGCLYLSLSLAGVPTGASVRRMEGFDLFTLEQEADQAELQAMALAAQELRMPLSNVMNIADQLFPMVDEGENPETQAQISKINRGLFQMLRIVSNMSDAYQYAQQTLPCMEVVNVTAVMEEIFEQSAELLRHGGIQLHFTNLLQDVFSLADREKLERAVHNIISNGVKFAPKGSPIHARLTQRGNMLYLSVQGEGSSIQPELRGNVHARFRRRPMLEDSRFGIGLGMVLIRSAAAIHGGTVLIDYPDGAGARLTMSMAINQNTDSVVRNGILRVDYAGERNHCLIELSDVLPNALYEPKKIN